MSSNQPLAFVKIRLRQFHQGLSRLKLYHILKVRVLAIIALFSIFAFSIYSTTSLDPSFNVSKLKELSNFTDISEALSLRKQEEEPYDIIVSDLLSSSQLSSSPLSQQLDHDHSSSSKHNRNSNKFIFINNKYQNAKGFQNIIDTFQPEQFMNLPLVDKCSIYFQQLYKKDPDWRFDELEDHRPYNGFIFDTKEQFIKDRQNEFRNSLENKDTISDDDFNNLIQEKNKHLEWNNRYLREFKDSYDTEQYMADQMTNLRVFSQCYLNNDISRKDQILIDTFDDAITCQENEKRLFKYLTRKFPTYVRWNREVVNKSLPVMEDYLNNENHTSIDKPIKYSSGCFTRDLRDAYNGKGIVISAMDKHVGELSSLILVLRALMNKLPIQIVHRGDLSKESQIALSTISRSLDLNLDEIKNFKKFIQTHFQDARDLNIESIFPKQEIWFVDASESIDPGDRRFVTYGNKLLTLLFSSFEDTVLIDTDTVPFVDIDKYILQSSVYEELGAFFFKDRLLYDRITGPETTFFKKLLPSRLDTAFFDIPELTNSTLQNRFFGEGFKHLQESGLVAINKKRHIRSVLTINALQMWHAATTRVHGDKELFWLGFSIAGDEDYYMNKYGVGAVGTLNPNSNRLLFDPDSQRRDKLKSHMLCTTHPAHLSGLDDQTLLWMNSGFITCKRQDEAVNDIKMDLYKNVFKDAEELKRTYVGPLKISAVLVPPPQERIINNELGEPSAGWDVMFGCGGYLYCAYDSVGGSNDSFYQGTLVEYGAEQQLLYDYLGEIWVYYDKVVNDIATSKITDKPK